MRALASSGYSAQTSVDIVLGCMHTAELELADVHSLWPYILTGAAAALVGGWLTAGGVAASNASSWREACPNGASCAAGFTRARYSDDGAAIDTEVAVSNSLFIAAGAAVLGAVIVWFVEGSPE